MTEQPSDPAREWGHRNFLCRIYQLGQFKVLGYVRIGDEWKQVVETEDVDEDVKSRVENEVDSIIREAVREETNDLDWPFDDPIDPNPNPGIDPIVPDPNPNPNPNPNPWGGPYWDDDVKLLDSGVTTVTVLSKDPSKLGNEEARELADSINTAVHEHQSDTF